MKRDKKKKLIVQGRYSGLQNTLENVKIVHEKLSTQDQKKIYEIISKHFFFTNLSTAEREDLIQNFKIYSGLKDEYIFRKGE